RHPRLLPGPAGALQVSEVRRLHRRVAAAGQRQDLQATAPRSLQRAIHHFIATKHDRRDMSGICEGRIVIVTGAGRGIGRGHALEFARQGARVVVNDLGAEVDGTGGSTGPAGEVVDEIRAMGGEAVANGDDVSDWEGAQRLVNTAIETFGGLDVLVNNAGILRDRMLVNMTDEEGDAVIRV